jgi:superfamily II DNA or RNA helicase
MKNSTSPDIREFRQNEAVDSFLNQGILKAAPRFGKILTSIKIMKRENPKKVLICFPRTTIKTSWTEDFEKWEYTPSEVVYTTFKSLHKFTDDHSFDFFIIDEIHEASRGQLIEMRKIVDRRIKVLALSGTITGKTEKEIFIYADLAPFYDYSIEQAVEEGILTDYKIIIHKVNLSTKPSSRYKDKNGKPLSEKQKFDRYMYVLGQMKKNTSEYFHLELKVINFLQKSITKLVKTKELIEKFKDERILVFCGVTEIADSLGIPAYHSKANEKQKFKDFCSGIGNHLATIKMAQAGVTVLPINKGIINYTSGNPEDGAQKICRFLGLEYDTPDKLAEIHIICSTENFEINRTLTSLQLFDDKKIKFI